MEEIFNKLIERLEIYGIKTTNLFKRDLNRLVKNNKKEFIDVFYNEAKLFKDGQYREYNKYEQLKKNRMTEKQIKKLKGVSLWRYEYRKNNYNLKCLCAYLEGEPTFLCAFIEDENKRNGNKTYLSNIDRVIGMLE